MNRYPLPILARLRPHLRAIEILSWIGWLALVVLSLNLSTSLDARPWLLVALIGAGLYNFALFHYLIGRFGERPAFYFAQVTYAVCGMTLVVWLTGALSSALGVLLTLLVVIGAMLGGRHLSLYTAGLSTLASLVTIDVVHTSLDQLLLGLVVRAAVFCGLAILVHIGMEQMAAQGRHAVEVMLRATRQTARQLAQMQVLHEMTVAVGASLDVPVVLDLALAKATEALRMDAGLIALTDEEAQTVTMAAHVNLPEKLVALSQRDVLRIGEGLIGEVMTSGHPVCTTEMASDPRPRVAAFAAAGFRTFVGIPLKSGARAFGALVVLSREAQAPDAEELEFLAAVGEQLGLAIQHARSYSSEHARRQLAESFSRIAQVIGEARGLNFALDAVLSELRAAVPYDGAAILLREGDALRAGAARGRGLEAADIVGAAIVTPSLWAALERGEPVTARDSDAGLPAGIRAWAGVPLARPDGLYGALLVDYADAHAFSPDEVQLLSAFARQAMTAIDRARLAAQASRRLQQLAALNRMGEAVSSALELPRVLQTAYEQVVALTGNRGFYIALYDDAAEEVRFPLYYEDGQLIQVAARRHGNGLTEYVVRLRRPVLIDDDPMEFGLRNGLDVHVTGTPGRSWLGVPLIKGPRVIGMMAVQDETRAAAYDAEDVELMQALAGQIAIAIDNAQFYESVRRNLAETEALFAFSQRTRETDELGALAEAAVTACLSVMPVDVGLLHLRDGEPPVLTPLAGVSAGRVLSASEAQTFVEQDLRVQAAEGVTGWVVTHRQTQRIGDVRGDARYVGPASLRSELCVPIIRQEQVLGVINVEGVTLDAYDARHERFLETLCGQLAVAIESARLADAERQHARELAGQVEISQAFGALDNPQATYAEVTRRLAQVFGVQGAVILLFDAVTQTMVAQAPAYGVSPQRLDETHYPLSDEVRQIWDPSNEPVWIVNELAATASPGVRYLAARFRSRQWIAAAMYGQSGLIGALYIFNRLEPGPFTARDGQLLSVLARQAALAIENARLIETERRSRAQLALVSQIDRHAGATLDLEPLIRDLVRQIRAAGHYYGVSLFFPEGDDLVLGASDTGFDPPAAYRQSIHVGTLGWTARHRQPRLVNDTSRAAEFVDPAHLGIRSELTVPLTVGDELVGVLTLAGDRPNQFDGTDLTLMQTIADRIAQAIFNARLYQRERRRANQIAAVSQLGREITAMLNLSDLLNRSVQLVRDRFQFARVRIFLADYEKDMAWLAAAAGGELSPLLITLPIRSPAAASRAIGEQRPVWDAVTPHAGVVLAVPIRSERVLGALEVQAQPLDAFAADDEAIVQTLADQLAVAIANAELHTAVERQARADSLTGVFNHGYFLQRLSEEMDAAASTHGPLALIMLDIDYFKRYNDTYGHVMGDRVLGAIVQAIRRNVKHDDIVGRWGGEEFGVVLPRANAEQALLVAARIRATLADMQLTDDRGRAVPTPTVSQGIAAYPEHVRSREELIDVADQMLYEAKSRGRDQVVLYQANAAGIQIRLPIQEALDEQA